MPRVLLSNDDGVDSPTLLPFVQCLSRWAEVAVVVPAREKSWIGKAITRFAPVTAELRERNGVPWAVVEGSPADCVNLAVHSFGWARPDLVVSGINLGLNFGSAFVLSSGTIGAVFEGWIAGLPAVAFSMAIPNDAFGLKGEARQAAVGERAVRVAEVASDIARTLWEVGFPKSVDAFSVNLPAEATLETPRRVTGVTRTRYGPLFVPDGAGCFRHRFSYLEPLEDEGDVSVVSRGFVAITPLRLDFSVPLPAALRQRLER
ncbi:MAG: stationary phase survival protein SurE [Candidatus Binatia bacterium]|nr:MAG: stationary phase survival protein SurE [Candidatus Binatia bacterium]